MLEQQVDKRENLSQAKQENLEMTKVEKSDSGTLVSLKAVESIQPDFYERQVVSLMSTNNISYLKGSVKSVNFELREL